jgi:hypothetical protein
MRWIEEKISGHDAQLNQIYEALENMLDKKAEGELNSRCKEKGLDLKNDPL